MAQVITFSAMGLPADYQLIDGWLVARGEQVLEQSRTHLIGEHNAENMLAALAVADLYENAPREVAIARFAPISRCRIGWKKSARSTARFSQRFEGDEHRRAGKGAARHAHSRWCSSRAARTRGSIFPACAPLLREKVRAVVLIGQMTEKLRRRGSRPCRAIACDTLAELRRRGAHAPRASGDTVLFSPGCSSYDMFKSFEDRGDQFRALVQALTRQPTHFVTKSKTTTKEKKPWKQREQP